MNIYLDIDGVILTKEGKQMPNLELFIDKCFEISRGNVYWLTTHCRSKENLQHLQDYLSNKVESGILDKLLKIKPTTWDTLKTEGIDFSNDFIWFDDNIFQSETKILREYNCVDSLIKVNNNLREITLTL